MTAFHTYVRTNKHSQCTAYHPKPTHVKCTCSVSPFTVRERQEGLFMKRHWTSDKRPGGTPDTSAPLMWGFSDSPVHTHRVSGRPGEMAGDIHG